MRESYEYYIEDIKYEDGRFEEELEDSDCEDEEEYLDYLCDEWKSGIQWYVNNFDNESFIEVCKKHDLINWDEVIEEVQDLDGRGCMAGYDGEEREQDVNGEIYYIYRTN